ncbi:hypothetical protein SEA_ENGINEER_164 [Gordonia Phage Engineer]|nr:hypothetical protein SEA_ENGINEER_164 [Gordonia Phage Engineer]
MDIGAYMSEAITADECLQIGLEWCVWMFSRRGDDDEDVGFFAAIEDVATIEAWDDWRWKHMIETLAKAGPN